MVVRGNPAAARRAGNLGEKLPVYSTPEKNGGFSSGGQLLVDKYSLSAGVDVRNGPENLCKNIGPRLGAIQRKGLRAAGRCQHPPSRQRCTESEWLGDDWWCFGHSHQPESVE